MHKIFIHTSTPKQRQTWNCSNCVNDSEKYTNLGWGQKVKQIGEWTSTEAASEEKGEEIEEDSERKMDVFGVTRDC